MVMAANIKKMLDEYHISYRTIRHNHESSLATCADTAGISKKEVVKTEILADEFGVIVLVVPLDKKINFSKLKSLIKRNVRVIPNSKANTYFIDCEPGAHPPFGEPYSLQTIVDAKIGSFEYVYFQPGSFTSFIQITRDDFLYLNAGSQRVLVPGEKVSLDIAPKQQQLQMEYEDVLKIFQLPSLPNIANKIMQLKLNQQSSIEELAKIISTDQEIHHQILSFAKLPFGQARGEKVDSIHDAINKVLGFNRVSHIVLGVSASREFSQNKFITDKEIHDFWYHAIFCATLAEAIAKKVAEYKLEVDPYLAYISGLMHNFGMLLFHELFPEEFKLLKKWLKLNEKVPITLLENRLIRAKSGLSSLKGGHAQLGAWLLKYWNMPEEAYVVAKEHHHPSYSGKFDLYVHIVWLANRILKKHGIGDAVAGYIPSSSLARLGISSTELNFLVKEVMSNSDKLSDLAGTLSIPVESG